MKMLLISIPKVYVILMKLNFLYRNTLVFEYFWLQLVIYEADFKDFILITPWRHHLSLQSDIDTKCKVLTYVIQNTLWHEIIYSVFQSKR